MYDKVGLMNVEVGSIDELVYAEEIGSMDLLDYVEAGSLSDWSM